MNHIEASKLNWKVNNDEGKANIEEINSGSLQRIATATEIMAKNHQELIDSKEFYRKQYRYYQEQNSLKEKSIAAYKGHITRLKREVEGLKNQLADQYSNS